MSDMTEYTKQHKRQVEIRQAMEPLDAQIQELETELETMTTERDMLLDLVGEKEQELIDYQKHFPKEKD